MMEQVTPSGDAESCDDVETASGLARAILDASTSAIILLDLNGRIRMFNPAACKLLGCSEASVLGENWLRHFAPEVRVQTYSELVEQYIQDGVGPIDLEGLDELRSASGEPRYVRCQVMAIRDSADIVSGVVCSVEDRTRSYNLMQGLASTRKVGLLGRLGENIAHNFNNLLQLIYGNAQLLLIESPDSARVEKILTAAERGTQHIQRMLAFVSRQDRSCEKIDLGQLVTQIVELLRICLLKNIQVATAQNLPAMHVVADTGEIESMLLNVAIIARDAMPNGGTLTIGYDPVSVTDADLKRGSAIPVGHFVRLSVCAVATGIPPNEAKYIFAPLSTIGVWHDGAGTFETSSEVGMGDRIDLYLPRNCEDLTDTDFGK